MKRLFILIGPALCVVILPAIGDTFWDQPRVLGTRNASIVGWSTRVVRDTRATDCKGPALEQRGELGGCAGYEMTELCGNDRPWQFVRRVNRVCQIASRFERSLKCLP